MEKELVDFLKTVVDSDKVYYTHVNQISPKGRFHIENNQIEGFWKLYCDLLVDKPDMISGIEEKPSKFTQLVADIDMVFERKDVFDLSQQPYTDEQLFKIVSAYQESCRSVIKDLDEKQLECFVLEKEAPRVGSDSKVHSGFHLQFPSIFLDSLQIEFYIIPKVKDLVLTDPMFDNMTLKIDSTRGKCWFLYGSRKEGGMPYKLTRILDSSLDEKTIEDALKDYEIFNVEEEKIPLEGYEMYHLPRVLSIQPCNRMVCELKPGIDCLVKETFIKAKDSRTYKQVPTEEAIELAKTLVGMLSTDRADDYNKWMEVGWVLYNVGDGSQEALELWISFSATTTKEGYFSEETCIDEWRKMKKRDLHIGTLFYMASQDSPEEYKKFRDDLAKKRYKDAIPVTHYDWARVLFEEFGFKYKCASAKRDVWYEFRDSHWEDDDGGMSLRSKISTYLFDYGLKKMKTLMDRMNAIDGDEEGDETDVLSKKIKKYQTVILNLKNSTYKNGIMKECKELFHDSKFIPQLDQNQFLIGFTNGVYDLREGRFRPTEPDDYIEKVTHYDFREFSSESPEVQLVEEYFRKVFPDASLRRFFMEWAAMLLKGGNDQKIFLIMTGSGHNAKSMTIELLQQMLGDYAITFPTSLITEKRTASAAASPEVARSAGARLAVTQEPNEKDELNIGTIKEFTGNDKVYARKLYVEGFEFKPMFKLVMTCNKLPCVQAFDKATWDRVRVLPFESIFLKAKEFPLAEYPDFATDESLQYRLKLFPRDDRFSQKLNDMKAPLMWLLTEEFKRIQREGLSAEPRKVMEATENYCRANNYYSQFCDDFLVADEKAMVTVAEIYSAFKEWFRSSFPNLKVPTRNSFKEHLIRKYGEGYRDTYSGLRLADVTEDRPDRLILTDDKLAPTDAKSLAVERDIEVDSKEVEVHEKVIEEDCGGDPIDDIEEPVEELDEEEEVS